MDSSTPGFPVLHHLRELAQTHVHRVGDAIQPSHPLSFPSPPVSIFPSIRVFSNESILHIRWPKYWSFSFSISPSNEYSGLTSFRMDWLDLPAVQGTLKSLLQYHSSKASVLRCSAAKVTEGQLHILVFWRTAALWVLQPKPGSGSGCRFVGSIEDGQQQNCTTGNKRFGFFNK